MKEEKGTKISSYNLPVTKQESTREGFGATEKKQWFKLEDLKSNVAPMVTNTTKTSGGKENNMAPGKKLGFDVKLDKNTRCG